MLVCSVPAFISSLNFYFEHEKRHYLYLQQAYFTQTVTTIITATSREETTEKTPIQ